mgnify:CR=1 FL=1
MFKFSVSRKRSIRTRASVIRALGQVLDRVDVTAQVLGDGPLAQAVFIDRPVLSHRDWLSADRQRGRAVMLELLRLGVFLNPMGTKLYLSLAHGENEIEELATHFANALRDTHYD